MPKMHSSKMLMGVILESEMVLCFGLVLFVSLFGVSL